MTDLLNKLTNKELSELLKIFDLATTGKKEILIKRIYDGILCPLHNVNHIKKFPVKGLRQLIKIFYPMLDVSSITKNELTIFIYEHRQNFIEDASSRHHSPHKHKIEKGLSLNHLTHETQYNTLSVNQLKELLREKNLSVTGNKDNLIQRLSHEPSIPLPSKIQKSSLVLEPENQYGGLTVNQLKAALREKKLKVTGQKEELIQRLTNFSTTFNDVTSSTINELLSRRDMKISGWESELIQRLDETKESLTSPPIESNIDNDANGDVKYEDLSKTQLKSILDTLGLIRSGPKSVLIHRLKECDNREKANYLRCQLPIRDVRLMLYQNGLPVGGSKVEMIARLSQFQLTQEYGKMTIKELRAKLNEFNYPIHGTKAELINRLLPDDLQDKLNNLDLELDEKTCEDLRNISRSLGGGVSGGKKNLIHRITQALKNPESLKGYIYILQSPVYNNAIKIGETQYRANINLVKSKLYNRYRTPLGANLTFHLFLTSKRKSDEYNVHQLLSKYRIPKTELFNIPIENAIQICQRVTGSSIIS